jgi:hypothetical protein
MWFDHLQSALKVIPEYAGEVWDNCTLADSERLKKIQLEAARIVTDLTSHVSILVYL